MPVYFRLTREAGLLEVRDSYMRAFSAVRGDATLGVVAETLLAVLGPVRVRVDAYGPDGGVFREFCCKCRAYSLGEAVEAIVRSRSPAALALDGVVRRAPLRIETLVAELEPVKGRYRGVRARLLLARNFLLEAGHGWRAAELARRRRFGRDTAIYIEGDADMLAELLGVLRQGGRSVELPGIDLDEAEEAARRACRGASYRLVYAADEESRIHLDLDRYGDVHGVYAGRPEMLAGIGVPASSTIIIECYRYDPWRNETRVVRRVRDGRLPPLNDPDVEAMLSICAASHG